MCGQRIDTDYILRGSCTFCFILFPPPPAQEPGDNEAALLHAFQAIAYQESMDQPHTKTTESTFENETAHVPSVACRLLCSFVPLKT